MAANEKQPDTADVVLIVSFSLEGLDQIKIKIQATFLPPVNIYISASRK